jgi:hypothetical protein
MKILLIVGLDILMIAINCGGTYLLTLRERQVWY